MKTSLTGPLALAGRILLAFIFLMSALSNKIPNFAAVSQYMSAEGVPAASFLLAGAIVFLIVGSASVITGFKVRVGAALLLVFLVLATYFFHDFWSVAEAAERQNQTIQFMKNLSLMGAMLFLIANGAGGWSVDGRISATSRNARADTLRDS